MIRKATFEDLEKIMEIYDAGRDFMRKNGNATQWINGYPSRKLIESDVENGICYVACQAGEIYGVFAFMTTPEPTYEKIYDGSWLNDKPYGTIHRVASSGKKHGVMKECTSFCKQKASTLRCDTHRDNKIMQKSLLNCGFEYCGIIYIEDGSERLAYQLN